MLPESLETRRNKMKKVSYIFKKDLDSIEADLIDMIRLAKEVGFLIDEETMYNIWRAYSDDYCAGWLSYTKEMVIEAIKEKGVIE